MIDHLASSDRPLSILSSRRATPSQWNQFRHFGRKYYHSLEETVVLSRDSTSLSTCGICVEFYHELKARKVGDLPLLIHSANDSPRRYNHLVFLPTHN